MPLAIHTDSSVKYLSACGGGKGGSNRPPQRAARLEERRSMKQRKTKGRPKATAGNRGAHQLLEGAVPDALRLQLEEVVRELHTLIVSELHVELEESKR